MNQFDLDYQSGKSHIFQTNMPIKGCVGGHFIHEQGLFFRVRPRLSPHMCLTPGDPLLEMSSHNKKYSRLAAE